MVSRIVVVFLLAVLAQARGATVKGTIILNEVGGRSIQNVQIIDSAHTGGPWASGSDGGFTLDYPERHPGQRVRLVVNKEGYVVVNDVQLDLALPADPDASPLQIILCKEADREEMARRFYRLKSFEVIEETYQRRVKELEATQQATAITVSKLQQERDQAKANAEKAAEEFAKNRPGQSSPLYRQALRLFLDGRIDDAMKVLDDEELRRTAEEGEKRIADTVQAWLLKGRLSTLKFRFEAAKEAYEDALHYLKREADPQLWAATQIEVGSTHAQLGIRVEGKAGNEHLTAAITAYRGALEVYTREQLPQQWAMTQNNLGLALKNQGLSSAGARANLLLAQAVAAFHSALEVYTRERLPRTGR